MDIDDIKFQQKKILKQLKECVGLHTSLVSVIMRPTDSITQMSQMLQTEAATASNIKSRVNRHSVEEAIGMAIFQLSKWKNTPKNGLFIFCGNCTVNGVSKQISLGFEPFKPICRKLYRCDSLFQTEEFEKLFESDTSYGFIIVDGNGFSLNLLKGENITNLYECSVSLPKKHNKGGQSSVRFARLRVEARANYVRKVAEEVNRHFLYQNKVMVQGIVVAGHADFKTVLSESDVVDPRIKNKIISSIDIAYGGKRGLYEAIELSKSLLSDMVYIDEKELLRKYFDKVANDPDITCYGVELIIKALFDLKIVSELFIYNDSTITVPNSEQLLTDFMVENHKNMDVRLHLISDKTQESSQFIKGFGGIGAILRYKYIFDTEEEDNTNFI